MRRFCDELSGVMNLGGYLTLGSMIMLPKFSNFPDELNENDELREYELSGPDCTVEPVLCAVSKF